MPQLNLIPWLFNFILAWLFLFLIMTIIIKSASVCTNYITVTPPPNMANINNNWLWT